LKKEKRIADQISRSSNQPQLNLASNLTTHHISGPFPEQIWKLLTASIPFLETPIPTQYRNLHVQLSTDPDHWSDTKDTRHQFQQIHFSCSKKIENKFPTDLSERGWAYVECEPASQLARPWPSVAYW
jgi:hypothetical protein